MSKPELKNKRGKYSIQCGIFRINLPQELMWAIHDECDRESAMYEVECDIKEGETLDDLVTHNIMISHKEEIVSAYLGNKQYLDTSACFFDAIQSVIDKYEKE